MRIDKPESKSTLTFTGSASGLVTIQPAAAAGTYTLTLPTDDGTASQFLQTDGSGVLTWATGANAALSNLASVAINTALLPASNDSCAIGAAGTAFSDLFLAEGAVINWDSGDATLTQVGDVVTLAGADLKVTTPGNVATSVVTTDATQTLSAKTLTAPTVNAATVTGNINIAAVPASDHTANGVTVSAFNLGATVALMDLVYLGASSKWLLTDADAAATAGGVLIGICLDGGGDTDTTTVATYGLVRDDTWNWTPGAVLYIDTATAGGLTATQPSGADDVIRVVGFAVTADVIFLNPSQDYITHT